MRGMVGRLCHGGERKPLEPYGVWAPFVRMVASALVFVASLGLVVGVAFDRMGHQVAVKLAATVVAVAGGSGLGLRFVAGFLKPEEVSLSVPEVEVRP